MGVQIYRDITVDFSNARYIILNAKRYDSKSRYIRITCTNLGQKVNLNHNDYSAFIRYQKPDGYGVFNKCVITDNSEIIFELTEQMLAAVGTSYADLVILDVAKSDINNDLTIISSDGRIVENNGSIASTMTFYINVIDNPIDSEEIESSNEYNALNDLLSQATKEYDYIVQTTQKYMDNAKVSETNAAQSEKNAAVSANTASQMADSAKKSLETMQDIQVTGVKGNAETAYRKGEVNLTPANIGAVNKTGDTMTGDLTAPTFIGSLSGNASTASKLGTATVGGTAKPIYLNAGTPTAISSTVGGTAKPIYMNAGTLTACSSTVGSATKPTYLNAGTVTACTYSLEKSVPSDAVFTDTTYSSMTGASTTAAGKAGLVPAPAAGAATRYLRSDGTWATPPNTTYSAATTSAAGLMSAADKIKLNGIATGAVCFGIYDISGAVIHPEEGATTTVSAPFVAGYRLAGGGMGFMLCCTLPYIYVTNVSYAGGNYNVTIKRRLSDVNNIGTTGLVSAYVMIVRIVS